MVQRYAYVNLFRPESFWYLYLSLTRQTTSQGEEETKFNWKRHRCFDRIAAANIFSLMMESTLAKVTKVTSNNTKKWYEVLSLLVIVDLMKNRKPLPLTTVELQKAGSRLLRLAPKKVLDVRISLNTRLYNGPVTIMSRLLRSFTNKVLCLTHVLRQTNSIHNSIS